MIENFTYVIDSDLQVQTYFIPIHSFNPSFLHSVRIALPDTLLPDTLFPNTLLSDTPLLDCPAPGNLPTVKNPQIKNLPKVGHQGQQRKAALRKCSCLALCASPAPDALERGVGFCFGGCFFTVARRLPCRIAQVEIPVFYRVPVPRSRLNC